MSNDEMKNIILEFKRLNNPALGDDFLASWIYFSNHPIYKGDYANHLNDMVTTQGLLNTYLKENITENAVPEKVTSNAVPEKDYTLIDLHVSLANSITGDTFEKVEVTNLEDERVYLTELTLLSDLENRSFIDPIDESIQTEVRYGTNIKSGIYSIDSGYILFGAGNVISPKDTDIVECKFYDLMRIA